MPANWWIVIKGKFVLRFSLRHSDKFSFESCLGITNVYLLGVHFDIRGDLRASTRISGCRLLRIDLLVSLIIIFLHIEVNNLFISVVKTRFGSIMMYILSFFLVFTVRLLLLLLLFLVVIEEFLRADNYDFLSIINWFRRVWAAWWRLTDLLVLFKRFEILLYILL